MRFEYFSQAELVITQDPIYPAPPLGQDMTQGQFF